MTRAMISSLALVALVAGSSVTMLGCGRQSADICERIDEECELGVPVEDCVQKGERVEDAAEESGCIAELDAYFFCLEEDVCGWETRCVPERSALEECSAPFPTGAELE